MIIGFLVILTNVCSLVILRKHWSVFEEVPRFLYQCIGVVDLIGGLSGCIYNILLIVESECCRSQDLYRFLNFTFLFGLLFSAIIISCLNIDRYIAISKPLRYPSIVNIRSGLCCFGLASGFPLIILILCFVPGTPFHRFSQDNYFSRNRTLLNQNVTLSEIATVFTLYSLSMVPICTGITLNIISMGIATRQARAIAALAVPRGVGEHNRGRRRVKLKGVKTVLLISVVNLISWVPANVRIYFTITAIRSISEPVDVLLTMLTLVNSWSNAFIFARTNVAYRRAARDSFRSIFCSQK